MFTLGDSVTGVKRAKINWAHGDFGAKALVNILEEPARLEVWEAEIRSTGEKPGEVHFLLQPCSSSKQDANSWVSRAAGISRHPAGFWPDRRGERSPEPAISARARKGVMALAARGKAGVARFMESSADMTGLTMPLAGPPLKRPVSAVWRAASLLGRRGGRVVSWLRDRASKRCRVAPRL